MVQRPTSTISRACRSSPRRCSLTSAEAPPGGPSGTACGRRRTPTAGARSAGARTSPTGLGHRARGRQRGRRRLGRHEPRAGPQQSLRWGVVNRSQRLPGGAVLKQADGTGWMARFCLDLMAIALELAETSTAYEALATKFFEHFGVVPAQPEGVGGSLLPPGGGGPRPALRARALNEERTGPRPRPRAGRRDRSESDEERESARRRRERGSAGARFARAGTQVGERRKGTVFSRAGPAG